MTIRARTYRSRVSRRAWLYSLIYASKISVLTVLLLCVSFLVQPFHQAFANDASTEELPLEESPVVAEPVQEQALEVASESAQIEDVSLIESENEESNEFLVTDSIEDSVQETDIIEDAEIGSSTTDLVQGDHDLEATSSALTTETDLLDEPIEIGATEESSDSGSGSVDEVSDTEPVDDPTDDASDNDDQNIEDEASSETEASELIVEQQSTSTPATSTAVKAENLLTEDNYYQFSRQSCVSIGDGTYHCSLSTTPGVDTNSVVYAEQDAGGDLEIFLRTAKGDIEQLTDNNYDDSSPYLDVESFQIVWHRLIDDRYQVILYNVESEKESQLTFSRTNNMEPKVSKDGVVWQAWDNNDWEIMYFDGNYTDQLTSNTAQDVAPVIEDGYILWSVLGDDVQEAMVYSLKTGQTMTITDHEGGSIINPRFVLVYDTKFDNGDIITQGFDPTTGLSAPIAAKPASEPIDIPSSDPTGEIRALIQNKSAQKEKEVVTVPTNTDTPNDSSVASAVTSSDTLDLKQIQLNTTNDIAIATTRVATNSQSLELTDYDLVITPKGSSTTAGSSTLVVKD
jgi:hypothetical protein